VGPAVSLEPEIRCWAHGEHSTVFAAVDPSVPISRIYFRCSLYPDYYFADLELIGDRYTAVLPQATAECPSVYYYVEAVSEDYTSSRTRERVAEVSEASECRRRDPLVALFTGAPKIILGATSMLAPEMAPGFSTAGIFGFIAASGASSAGSGLGTVAIAGIGGAAVAGGVLAAASGDSTPAQDPAPAPPVAMPPIANPGVAPTPAPPAPPAPAPGGDTTPLACVSTDPKPAVIGAGDSIRLDASCSLADRVGNSGDGIAEYIWDISDGRRKNGRVVNALFRNPGVYEITLTVIDGGTSVRAQQDSDTIEVTVEDRVDACFTTTDIDPGGGCKIRVDASCSQGNIELYEWNMSDGFGNYRFTGRSVTKDWVSCPLPIWVTLTVVAEGGKSDSVQQQVNVNFLRTPEDAPRTQILGTVSAAKRNQGARLVSNNRETMDLQSSTPHSLQLRTQLGTNSLMVYPMGPEPSSGVVTLDFTSAPGLVPGSLRVLEGDVVTLGARKVVVRLKTPARLEYVLR
jgi:hypothetical protein